MGDNSACDVPGNWAHFQIAYAGHASNAASATYPLGRAAYTGSVKYCAIIPSTSSVSVADKNTGLTLINSGSAGTGTVVLGSFLGTTAYASYKPFPLTLAATPTVSAGDVLSLAWASASSTTVMPAGIAHLQLTYI
ncbi:hypothetical protein M0R72_10825 [Candidatus Pacearchaeota archaeon]|jgi:hypothetical protein|nr:hypothetical protein [Candidatus Pacearchaeota archaeon]